MGGFGSIIAAMISVATILLASYVCSKGGFYMANGSQIRLLKCRKTEMKF